MRKIVSTLILAAAALGAPLSHAFDLQGHRGARGLAPENTLPAFERALQVGVSTLELDIGVTTDGVVVVAHDPYLNPAITRDGTGRWLEGKGPLLRNLTWAQLQTYDVGRIKADTPYAATFATQEPQDGTRVPSLAQLFERVKARNAGHVRFNIETKIDPRAPADTVGPAQMVEALLKVIREAGMTRRVTIQSFDWRTLQMVQLLEPSIPTVYLTVQTANNDNTQGGLWTADMQLSEHGGSIPRMVKAAGGKVWSPNAGSLTEAAVKEAQGLGLKVVPWTVNNPADMERIVGWGVDGLITDYPDRLREVLARKGIALPPQVK